ncbi:unnamed protein product [Pleuronectes platessa]|uniref:Uncharacterized protein n=1 Tax=Pleuronectes platessa TaxID=8262 RepID=A0A9N7V4D9_PLEPL|nr:unnamed protein product [Pleuronectes platessa]
MSVDLVQACRLEDPTALISRDLLLSAACDAVAVGLIDRKHVGVVGANRDAAAATGDRDLHPVLSSAPVKPTGLFTGNPMDALANPLRIFPTLRSV